MFIFPLEGDNPTRHSHYFLWAIIIICFVLFFITLINGKEDTFQEWGYIPALNEHLNVFTSMFLHGGRWHIIGNMLFLWMFGDNIEDVVGHMFFLLCYLICGIAATFTYASFHPDSLVPLIGASGAISGLIGMYLVFFPKISADIVFYIFYWEIHKVKTTIFVAIACWFGIQILFSFLIEATSLGKYVRIAFSAHAGGFVAGLVLGFVFLKLGYIRRYMSNGRKHWLLGYST